MIDDLILRVQYQGSTHDLPVDSEVPLRIDMSAVENGEIGTFFGIGSQTFNLPGTREVNRFFNHGYDISIDDIPGMYNSIPCAVIHNGETLIQGQLILEEIITREDGDVTYSVNVSDNTVQFKNNLEGKLLSDLNLDAYNHQLTTQFVTMSWLDNRGTIDGEPQLGGAIFYPMADYGTDGVVSFPDQPKIMMGTGSFNVTTGSINNPTTPMLLQQFQPAIRLPELMTAVFDQAGFEYVSSFIDANGQDMYLLPKANDNLGPVLSDFNDLDVTNTSQIIPAIPAGTLATGSLQFDIENLDQADNYNTSSFTYTCPLDNPYKVDYGIAFPNVGAESGVLIGYTVELLLNGVLIDNAYTAAAGGSSQPVVVFGSFTGNFFATNQLTLRYRITNFNGTVSTNQGSTSSGGYFKVDTKLAFEGATINMADQFDPKAKSIDLVTGLIEQFNLIIVPEPNQDRVLRVETFDEWIRRGERKDWTFRYDTAKKIGINHTVDEQPKQLLFENEKDADRISKVYTESVPNYQFGTVRNISDSNIPQGEKEIGSFFAPVVTAPMISSSVFLDSDRNPTTTFTNEFTNTPSILPHLYKFENNEQKTYKFKPRLGYKINGIQAFRGDQAASFFIEDEGSTLQVESYATLSSVYMYNPFWAYPFQSGLTRIYDSSKTINYDNSDLTYMPPLYTQASSGSNAYVDYWETYIESLYWEGSKKLTLDLYFEPFEYKDIQLNDRIVIKNQVYRINKISGFNISQPDVVKVELIKLYPEYITPGNEIEPWPEPLPPNQLAYTLQRCSDGATGFRTTQFTTEIALSVGDRVTDTEAVVYTVLGTGKFGLLKTVTDTGETGCPGGPPAPGAGRQMFLIYPSNASNPSGEFLWTCQDGSSDSVTLGWDQDWYACIQDGTSVIVPPGGLVVDYGLGCLGCTW